MYVRMLTCTFSHRPLGTKTFYLVLLEHTLKMMENGPESSFEFHFIDEIFVWVIFDVKMRLLVSFDVTSWTQYIDLL